MKKRKGLSKAGWSEMALIGGLLVFILVVWIFLSNTLPARYAGAESGFDLLTMLLDYGGGGGGTMRLIQDFVVFIAVPFLTSLAIVWGVFENAAGRIFSRRIAFTIALLFSISMFFTQGFLYAVYAVAGLGGWFAFIVGAYAVFLLILEFFTKTSSEKRRSFREHHKDEDLIKRGEKIDKELDKLHTDITDSQNNRNVPPRVVSAAHAAQQADVSDLEHLKELKEELDQVRKDPDRTVPSVGESVIQLVNQKLGLAREFRKHQEKEDKEEHSRGL